MSFLFCVCYGFALYYEIATSLNGFGVLDHHAFTHNPFLLSVLLSYIHFISLLFIFRKMSICFSGETCPGEVQSKSILCKKCHGMQPTACSNSRSIICQRVCNKIRLLPNVLKRNRNELLRQNMNVMNQSSYPPRSSRIANNNIDKSFGISFNLNVRKHVK